MNHHRDKISLLLSKVSLHGPPSSYSFLVGPHQQNQLFWILAEQAWKPILQN